MDREHNLLRHPVKLGWKQRYLLSPSESEQFILNRFSNLLVGYQTVKQPYISLRFLMKIFILSFLLLILAIVVIDRDNANGEQPEVEWKVEYYNTHLYGETNLYRHAYFEHSSGHSTNFTYIHIYIHFQNGSRVNNLSAFIEDPSQLFYRNLAYKRLLEYREKEAGYIYTIPTKNFDNFIDNTSFHITARLEYYENDSRQLFNSSMTFHFFDTIEVEFIKNPQTLSLEPLALDIKLKSFVDLDLFKINQNRPPVSISWTFAGGKNIILVEDIASGTYYYNGTIAIADSERVREKYIDLKWEITAYIGDIKLYQSYSFQYKNLNYNNIIQEWSDITMWPTGLLTILIGIILIVVIRNKKNKSL